jgi:ankyrin repeat protein
MDAKELPARPNLEQYKNQAKDLVKLFKSFRNGAAVDPETIQRIKKHHPRLEKLSRGGIRTVKFALADAQLVIAREHGFESWPKFAKHVEVLNLERSVASLKNPAAAFIEAACVPRDAWHASGTLDRAEAILAAYPGITEGSIHIVAILGEDAAVRRFLAHDPRQATAKGGPYRWDALTHLCFSRYLKLDPARSEGFVRAARALLDAGANANTGWMEEEHDPRPTWESAIYGAAGVAHHAELTRLLLDRGADPNDDETPYHAPETRDNAALQVLVKSGKLNDDSLATMLLRKTDWHDYEGVKWLLENGADPNRKTRWGKTAVHHAVLRDNDIKIIQVLMEHHADPTLVADNTRPLQTVSLGLGKSAVTLAGERGRGDVLELFERQGIATELRPLEELIAACARNDSAKARVIAAREPHLVRELRNEGGRLLTQFAGVGNTGGIRLFLELGVDVAAMDKEGDPYFNVAKDSTALHSASWRARHETVKFLIERGAPVNALDGKGRTPLALAVRACVDSYWSDRRSPDSAEALLRAGASVDSVDFPCGYAEVDKRLLEFGKTKKS